ncbi:MAG: hypothetical protein ACQKBU_11000 [Verrucomicrobiales bacterium]
MIAHPARHLLVWLTILALGTAFAEVPPQALHLPLRVHLITGIEMIRLAEDDASDPTPTVMGMPVTIEQAAEVMNQVNEIWAPSGIVWVTDPEQGGGGILEEQAGGGHRTADELRALASLATARDRGTSLAYMDFVFPALADPANNESISKSGLLKRAGGLLYHLYLFPYVGRTLQGTATLPGTFAIVGVHSDKRPHRRGYPKPRPLLVPPKTKPTLSPANFPAAGALSATIAHELGHNLGLRHVDEGLPDNLMKGQIKLRLAPPQTATARKHAMAGPRI